MPRPALGSEVRFATGSHSGALGYVWDDGSSVPGNEMLKVKLFDTEEVVTTYPSELAWTASVPPIDTPVELVYIASMEGVSGRVTGYVNVATINRIETVLGYHHGCRACLVDTFPAPHGTLPILPENLLWTREVLDPGQPEVTPLPPPGVRTGDIDPLLLPNPSKTAVPDHPIDAHDRPKTALHQLLLRSGRKEVLVRSHPHGTGRVVKRVYHHDVLSLVLPSLDASDPPEGWCRLLSGGFFRLLGEGDALLPLSMRCPLCAEGFATEQSAREHFRTQHPDEEYRVSLSGGDTEPDKSHYAEGMDVRLPMVPSSSLPQVTRPRETGTSPAWFNLQKPRRSSASVITSGPSSPVASARFYDVESLRGSPRISPSVKEHHNAILKRMG